VPARRGRDVLRLRPSGTSLRTNGLGFRLLGFRLLGFRLLGFRLLGFRVFERWLKHERAAIELRVTRKLAGKAVGGPRAGVTVW
jgi:hypothetical protein